MSRPTSAAPTAPDLGATIRVSVANLHNADIGKRTRHTKSSRGSFEASLKDNRFSRPFYYPRGSVPGDTSILMSFVEGGGSARVLPEKRGGNLKRDDAWVSYLPFQPMEKDPPHQSQTRTSNADRDTLKACSYVAIPAVVMALVAAGLFWQR